MFCISELLLHIMSQLFSLAMLAETVILTISFTSHYEVSHDYTIIINTVTSEHHNFKFIWVVSAGTRLMLDLQMNGMSHSTKSLQSSGQWINSIQFVVVFFCLILSTTNLFFSKQCIAWFVLAHDHFMIALCVLSWNDCGIENQMSIDSSLKVRPSYESFSDWCSWHTCAEHQIMNMTCIAV